MARVMPIILKLQQPFEMLGFAPVVPNVLPGITRGVVWEPSTSEPNYQLSLDRLSAKTSGKATVSDILLLCNTSNSSGGYFEVVINAAGGGMSIGLSSPSEALNNWVGAHISAGFNANGNAYHNGGVVATLTTYSTNTIGVCRKGNSLYFSKDGVWQGGGDPSAGTGGIDVSTYTGDVLIPAASTNNSALDITARFTAASMAYPIPTGVTAWDGTTTTTDVTLTLTGQSLSIAQGSLLASTALALTGQPVSVTQGSVTPGISKALSGQALSAAQGSLAPATTVALSGQSLTVARGTLTANISLTLTGQTLSVAQGSVTQSRSIALSGLATTVGQGSVGRAITITLSGLSLAVGQGSVTVAASNVTVALTGLSLSVAQGSVTGSITARLTGQSASVSKGSIAPSLSLTLSGQTLTSSQGSIVGQQIFPTTPFTQPTISLGFRRQRPTNTAWGNGDLGGAVWKPDTDATNDWSNSGGQSGTNWKKKS